MNLPAKLAHGKDPILQLIHRCKEPGCDGLMGNACIHKGSNNPAHHGFKSSNLSDCFSQI
jgi:hypothetical protein